MQLIDLIAKVILSALAAAFIAGVISGMAVLGYAIYRDFLARDEYDSLFDVGPRTRDALMILKPWFRRLVLVWVGMLATAIMRTIVYILFGK